MLNLLISLTLAISSYLFFRFTYSLNGINRLVLNTPIEYFNVAIPLVKNDEEIKLYFDKSVLENNLNEYFLVLSQYCSSYSVNYYYYNQNDDSICLGQECSAVEVRVNCTIDFNVNYYRAMFYEIGSRND